MRLGSQGGSQTSSMSTSLTPGIVCTLARASSLSTSPIPQPGAVMDILISTRWPPSGERPRVAGVDQPEIDDVDGDLRVEDGLELLDHMLELERAGVRWSFVGHGAVEAERVGVLGADAGEVTPVGLDGEAAAEGLGHHHALASPQRHLVPARDQGRLAVLLELDRCVSVWAHGHLLRRDPCAVGFEGASQRVPGEGGALHPHRKLPDAGEHRELAQLRRGRPRRWALRSPWRGQRPKRARASSSRLALERRGHQRGRGLGDGASGALEGDVGDAAVGELHVERELVAAQRVVALGRPVGALELAEVPRRLRLWSRITSW